MTTALVPCPLCGAAKGFFPNWDSAAVCWWLHCSACREPVASFINGDLPINEAGDEAWNSAGKHAQGLRDEIARLRAALNAMLTQFGMDEDEWSKPAFNQARAALAKEPK